ncbi:hypothetical protein Tco_1199089 [Tanacetum coccineum]
MQQPMKNPEDILDPTTAIDMALVLMAKAFQLNNTTPTTTTKEVHQTLAKTKYSADCRNLVGQNAVQNLGIQNVKNRNGLSVVPGIAHQYRNGNVVAAQAEGNGNRINSNHIRCYNCQGEGHYASNYTVKPRKRDAAYLQIQMQIAQKEEAGIQLTPEEFDFMAVAGAFTEIEKVNANCILMANLQQASTSEEQYTEILDPITEPHMIQQNNSNVIYVESSMEHNGGTVEQHLATVEETRAYFE